MEATDDTYESLTSSGVVVVAFHDGGSGWTAGQSSSRDPLEKAARECRLPCVLVDRLDCTATVARLRVIGFPTIWLLKDGELIADLAGHFAGGSRSSRRLNYEHFKQWLSSSLPE